MKERLLYLCHRMPFPPNKGDKITTFNVLKFLSEHYDVYLGTFIDDPIDRKYCEHVSRYCKESFFVDLNPFLAKIKGLTAFISGEPITLPYYRNGKMQSWVSKIVANKRIKKAFIYSSCMAQYVLNSDMSEIYKVIQFADIDSDKWRQFAATQNMLMNKIYSREFNTLLRYEKFIAEKFNLSCFISDSEVNLFKTMIDPCLHGKIKTLSNGIDSDYFSPLATSSLSENYYLQSENYIVFTGAMDYQPNVETVVWFIEHVWLEVIKNNSNCKFYIVGSSPTKKVMELTKYPSVVVTGRVVDVRPYLAGAKAAVAPMQIARGIQNKILEAMAMELPVLTTELGAEGLEDYLNKHLFISNSKESMRRWVSEKLENTKFQAKDSRIWLEKNYSWDAQLNPLLHFFGA